MSLQIPVIHETDSARPLEVDETVFGQPYNEGLVHQLIVTHLARARAGTKAQKGRSDVSGGGRKPWRQKGTGHARAGTTRGPLWRTGGKAFAARPREFDPKLNKKMYRAGMRAILSELLRQGRLYTAADVFPQAAKTKELHGRLKSYAAEDVLIVATEEHRNLALAARNLPAVDVRFNARIDPVALVGHGKVILTAEAARVLEEQLK